MSRKDNRDRAPRCEPLPPRPPALTLVEFNQPQPTFSSDVQHIKKKSFFFGIDESHFTLRQPFEQSFWASHPIDISLFEEIKLIAHDFEGDRSSIEYTFIFEDGRHVPVFPENKTAVHQESVGIGKDIRFVPSTERPIHVFDNGILSDVFLEDALEESPGRFTVSYVPSDIRKATIVPAEGNFLRVGITMRLYDKQTPEPYVEGLFLKGYEGGITWRQVI